MDKKYFFGLMLIMVAVSSCRDKRQPRNTYMPDMAYSRAYEAYDQHNLKQAGINYVNHPVDGTIKRGDLFAYTLTNDSNGYNMSASVKDPLPPLDSVQMLEAQRLFNINCAICHGVNMDAQGPLAVSGKVGGIANLKLEAYTSKTEGQMFHVVTYGKGNMGSYAAQLDRKQRWMVVQYVKATQAKGATGAKTTTAATDTAAKK